MRNLDYLQFLMRLVVELLNILERKSERIKINHTQTAVAVGWLVAVGYYCCCCFYLCAVCGDYSPPRSNIFLCCLIFSCFSSCVIIGIDSLAKQFVVFSLRPPRCVCVLIGSLIGDFYTRTSFFSKIQVLPC